MKTALLFPGQGSQRIGMGRDLAQAHEAARQVFEEADDALGFRLSTLCWEGPEAELTLTHNAQPAILATSIAVHRVLEGRGLRGDIFAGHSLGEWSALVAAGSLTLRDAVRLVRLRGTFMQEAVPVGEGGMAAIMGLSPAEVHAVCERASRPGEPVEPANYNGASQIVLSGQTAAIDRAVVEAKAAGAKRAIRIAVSAPFHCSLMQPAADRLAAALAGVAIAAPSVPVVSNVTAEPTRDPGRIKALIVRQVTAPVRWEESAQLIAKLGVDRAYELGPGAVLKGLVKRIAPAIDVAAICEPQEIDAWQSAASAA